MIDTGYLLPKSARASWAARSEFIGGSSRKPQASRAANPVAIRVGRYPECQTRRARSAGRRDETGGAPIDSAGRDVTGPRAVSHPQPAAFPTDAPTAGPVCRRLPSVSRVERGQERGPATGLAAVGALVGRLLGGSASAQLEALEPAGQYRLAGARLNPGRRGVLAMAM